MVLIGDLGLGNTIEYRFKISGGVRQESLLFLEKIYEKSLKIERNIAKMIP